MTPCAWTDQLSAYLDGDLPPGERAALEAHLQACDNCRAILADLRLVVAQARSLPDLPPTRDLWPAVSERTSGVVPLRAGRGRPGPGWLPLAAAATLLLATGSGITWLALAPRPSGVATAPPPADSLTLRAASGAPRERRGTADAVAELERLLAEGRGRLDTATTRVLIENLARIDSALAAAQAALAADSANAYVLRHLAETERRKLELLRTAARLVQARS